MSLAALYLLFWATQKTTVTFQKLSKLLDRWMETSPRLHLTVFYVLWKRVISNNEHAYCSNFTSFM